MGLISPRDDAHTTVYVTRNSTHTLVYVDMNISQQLRMIRRGLASEMS